MIIYLRPIRNISHFNFKHVEIQEQNGICLKYEILSIAFSFIFSSEQKSINVKNYYFIYIYAFSNLLQLKVSQHFSLLVLGLSTIYRKHCVGRRAIVLNNF